MIDIMKLDKKFSKYPNYRGMSRELMPKITDGKETAVTCIRIYVSKKVPKELLKKKELFPMKVDNTLTDVVELGDVRTFPVDKTVKFNPVPDGVSIGNWNITAGSRGPLYTKDGEIYVGSNSHVLCEDPTVAPEDVKEKRICQPGPYHNPARDQIAGEYHWHDRIKIPGQEPSQCIINRAITWLGNLLSNVFKRNTVLKAYAKAVSNYQDFAVYKPVIPHNDEIADGSFDKTLPFVGHLFAGSDVVGILCKVKYAVQSGYTPIVDVAEVQLNDEVCGCSFWCNYRTKVIDPSALITVGGYGNSNIPATFDDVILVANDNVIRGGWSGSGFRAIK